MVGKVQTRMLVPEREVAEEEGRAAPGPGGREDSSAFYGDRKHR